MPTDVLVLLVAALLTAAAAVFVLRAYRRAPGGESVRAAPAFAIAGAVGVGALSLYMTIGSPALADAAYEDRLAALRDRDPMSYTIEEALAVLHEGARNNPTDPQPHFFSAELLMQAGRPQDAARSYDAALRRAPQFAPALLGLGRAMVQIDEGRVSPEAVAVFQQAAALSDDPAPWLYQAMAAMQTDNQAEARRLWREALGRMAPDDPRRAMATRMAEGQE